MRSRTATAAIALAIGLALASSAAATYPGRDGRIAFVARVGCDRNSEPGDPCAEESYAAIATIPDWSPDGRRLAVARTDLRTGLSAIVDVSASGGRARVIVRACLAGDPVWSPAGSRLAFASTCLDEPSDDDAPSVYAVRPDGSRVRRLFDPTDLSPPEAPVARYVSPALSWQPRP